MSFGIKKYLVGTQIGYALSHVRDVRDFLRTPRVALGTLVNDQLAVRLVTKIIEPGKAFVDVGAHIGSVSAEVMRSCKGVAIIMFEAIPEKAEWLSRRFPGAEVHCKALGEEEGTVSFYIDQRESGYSSLSNRRGAATEIKVPLARIDTLVHRDDVDVIKIDVEGAELGVLRGAEQVIARCKPLIMYESGPEDHLGYTKEAMFDWLNDHDYQIFAPNRLAHTGGPMDLHGYLDSHEYPRRTTNYFALPAARVDEFRNRARTLGGWT